jgi:hypothetical protein
MRGNLVLVTSAAAMTEMPETVVGSESLGRDRRGFPGAATVNTTEQRMGRMTHSAVAKKWQNVRVMTSATLPDLETPDFVHPRSRLRAVADWPRPSYPIRLKKSAASRPDPRVMARTLNPACYSTALFASGEAYAAVSE